MSLCRRSLWNVCYWLRTAFCEPPSHETEMMLHVRSRRPSPRISCIKPHHLHPTGGIWCHFGWRVSGTCVFCVRNDVFAVSRRFHSDAMGRPPSVAPARGEVHYYSSFASYLGYLLVFWPGACWKVALLLSLGSVRKFTYHPWVNFCRPVSDGVEGGNVGPASSFAPQ